MNESRPQLLPSHPNLIASVLLAEIAGYEDRPVFEQIDLTSRSRQLVELALAETPCEGVLVIDRESSIVLLFPGDPMDCLKFATWLEHTLHHDPRLAQFPLRVGVNLGPVTVTRSERGEIQAQGAGIDDALRVANAGLLREVLMSRSFYTVLSRASMNDRLLRHKTFISDELDQSFAVYQIARPEPTAAASDSAQKLLPMTAQPNRSRAGWSAVAATALLAAGAFALFQRQTPQPPQQVKTPPMATKPIVVVQSKPAPSAAIVVTEPDPSLVVDTESKRENEIVAAPVLDMPVKAAQEPVRKVAAAPSAIVQLAIKPWGEIFVDGKSVGITPPLHKIKLPAGRREIVVRNAEFIPYQTTIDVQPESLLQVSHRFDK
jgi:hypothetical protein